MAELNVVKTRSDPRRDKANTQANVLGRLVVLSTFSKSILL